MVQFRSHFYPQALLALLEEDIYSINNPLIAGGHYTVKTANRPIDLGLKNLVLIYNFKCLF